MSNHFVKFHKDLISSFWVILLIGKQQTDRHRWKRNLLGGFKYTSKLWYLNTFIYFLCTLSNWYFKITNTKKRCCFMFKVYKQGKYSQMTKMNKSLLDWLVYKRPSPDHIVFRKYLYKNILFFGERKTRRN